MRRFGLSLIFLLLFIPLAQATHISHYNIDLTVDGGLVTEKLTAFVTFQGEDSIKLIAPPEIQRLDVKINNIAVACDLRDIIGGSEITCPVNVQKDYFIDAVYQTDYPLVSLKDKQLLSQEFKFSDVLDDFNLNIKLPVGALLPEDSSKFLNPKPQEIYFDGRRVVLQYQSSKIDSYKTSVIYVLKTTSLLFVVPWFLLFIGLLFLIRFKIKKTKKEEVYLLPHEKEVIKILKNSKEPIRQRDIEKRIDFSKAKLSRMLRSLEERNLVERIPKGNANLIKLKKM